MFGHGFFVDFDCGVLLDSVVLAASCGAVEVVVAVVEVVVAAEAPAIPAAAPPVATAPATIVAPSNLEMRMIRAFLVDSCVPCDQPA
jgi:hypothetical protein